MTRKYGSRWIGKRVTDCSGLLSWAFKQLGGTMYHGANTIWNRWCTAQGTLDASTKLKPGSAVFLFDGKKRHHVGLYIGNDTVVEAKGTCYGVVTSNVDHWDEWGELKGVDYTGVTADAMPASYGTATLRKGSRGDSVKRMQQLLVDYGYQIEVDGVFGTNTRRAVEVFQAAHNLAADGICGPKTWDALLTTTATEPDTKVDNEPVKEEQPPTIEERVDALEQAVFGGVKA